MGKDIKSITFISLLPNGIKKTAIQLINRKFSNFVVSDELLNEVHEELPLKYEKKEKEIELYT